MEGLLEWLAAHGVGSTCTSLGDGTVQCSPGIYQVFDIKDGGRTLSAYQSSKWYPDGFIFWWLATRIIETAPGTFGIHEMPFFSFLLGDLHPHVMALPYTLVALALAWNAALPATQPVHSSDRPWLMRVAISGAIVGSLWALNTWDYPTFLLLFVIGVWAGAPSWTAPKTASH